MKRVPEWSGAKCRTLVKTDIPLLPQNPNFFMSYDAKIV